MFFLVLAKQNIPGGTWFCFYLTQCIICGGNKWDRTSSVLLLTSITYKGFHHWSSVFTRSGRWRGCRDDKEEAARVWGRHGYLLILGVKICASLNPVLLMYPWPSHWALTLIFSLCHLSALPLPVKLGWSPDPGYTSPHRWIPTPDQEEDQPVTLINAGFPHYNFNNIFTTPVHCAPLPALWWVLLLIILG